MRECWRRACERQGEGTEAYRKRGTLLNSGSSERSTSGSGKLATRAAAAAAAAVRTRSLMVPTSMVGLGTPSNMYQFWHEQTGGETGYGEGGRG